MGDKGGWGGGADRRKEGGKEGGRVPEREEKGRGRGRFACEEEVRAP